MNLAVIIGIVTTRVLLALFVLMVGIFGATFAKRKTLKLLSKTKVNEKLALIKFPYDIEGFLGILVFYLIYILTAVIALWLLGIASLVMWGILFLLVLVTILSVASFLKDFVPNVRGWFMIKRVKNFRPGNKVRLTKINGTIKKVRFIETLVETKNGDLVRVPNALFKE